MGYKTSTRPTFGKGRPKSTPLSKGMVRGGGWLLEHLLPAATIFGALFYVLIRYSYVTFYDDFGLEPEDVGLDYARTLTQAAIPLLGILLIGLLAGAFWSLGMLGVLLIQRRRSKNGPETKAAMPSTRDQVAAGLFFALGTFLFYVTWFFIFSPFDRAEEVQSGSESARVFLVPSVKSEPVLLTWTGDAPAGLADLEDHQMMHLGTSGGSEVLYDVTCQATVRIPSSLVILRSGTAETDSGSLGCPPSM